MALKQPKKVAMNQKLWNSIMRQAKAKFPLKNPNAGTSFAINDWASKQYVQQGGQWVGSMREVPQEMRDLKTEALKKKQAKDRKAAREDMAGGI